MADNTVDVQELPVDKEKDTNTNSGKRPKFLLIGKYFLFAVLFAGQVYLSYTIVDKNYAEVYHLFHVTEDDSFATYQLEEMVVNPAQTNGKRYLLVEISLELASEEHIELLERNNMKLKQDMIEALSARTIPQLTTSEGRDLLREDLIRIINRSIGAHSVRNLYFTKYVMQ